MGEIKSSSFSALQSGVVLAKTGEVSLAGLKGKMRGCASDILGDLDVSGGEPLTFLLGQWCRYNNRSFHEAEGGEVLAAVGLTLLIQEASSHLGLEKVQVPV